MKKTQNAKAAAKPFQNAAAAGKQTIDAFVKAGNDATAKGYEQAVQMTQANVAKANSAFIKGYENFQGFGKENVDAIVQASTIFAKGAEQISKQVMALTQSSMQSSVVTAKALMGCKTLRDVIDLQAGFARSNFDSLVAEGAKLSELSYKVTNAAIAPIQARVTVAVEKLTKPIAA